MLMAIVNHLWQSTLFLFFIGALCYLLRRDGAHIRYWLWWTASIKFLLPFSALAAAGQWLASRTALSPVPEAWSNTMTVIARPFAGDGPAMSPAPIVISLWTAGSLLLIGAWAWRARRLRATLNRAQREPMPLHDGRRRIPIYRATDRIEPGVVGLLRTALMLPAGLEKHLTSAQFEAVIAHELCHIRRRDNLTAAIHMLVEALFWFHPLVWWIGARLIDERERACDEMVVALGHDRETYAGSILDVCEHYAATPLPCTAGISGSDLKRRITQIMRYPGTKSLQPVKKWLLSIAAFAALAIPMLAGLAINEVALAQVDDTRPLPLRSSALSDGEYLPIVKVAPIYPPRAATRGLEGHVIVRYTVGADGSTRDAVVIESTSTLFDRSAIESTLKYKYKPRIVNNTAVDVPGVTTKIIFALEGGPPPGAATPATPAAPLPPIPPPAPGPN